MVAGVLPLPAQMRLIKGRKAKREEPRNEERFRFPAVQEPWEVSCASHGGGNVIVLLLFAVSWWLRRAAPQEPIMFAYVLSFGGGIIALFTGWLGGELVDRLAVGVDPGAHVDAPSSLRSRRAA